MKLEKNENIVFKNYKAVRPLGRGSYGNVYEMYDFVNHESFALKEIPISSENVSSFMAEILPDCVVCHKNIQKYHPFAISKRPDILKNLSSCTSPKKELSGNRTIRELKHNDLNIQNCLSNLINFDNSGEIIKEKIIKEKIIKEIFYDINNINNCDINNYKNCSKKGRIIFENTCKDEIVRSKKKINRSHSWSLGQKLQNNVTAKSRNFFMYLRTEICDFSLRDFIDFRNHQWFRIINDDKASVTFEGQLNNQVEIPIDFYKQSVKEDKQINKQFLLRLVRCIIIGLIHLHSFGVAHNDIKCSNILLDSKDFFTPKIADFGMRSYCEEKHDIKNLEKPYNFYDYCTSFSRCQHFNQNKANDCKALVYILYELLYPCKTQSEMLYLKKELKRKKTVPKDFKVLYNAEANLIENILADNKITASSMLTMFDNIIH